MMETYFNVSEHEMKTATPTVMELLRRIEPHVKWLTIEDANEFDHVFDHYLLADLGVYLETELHNVQWYIIGAICEECEKQGWLPEIKATNPSIYLCILREYRTEWHVSHQRIAEAESTESALHAVLLAFDAAMREVE